MPKSEKLAEVEKSMNMQKRNADAIKTLERLILLEKNNQCVMKLELCLGYFTPLTSQQSPDTVDSFCE